jgi:hypothetical protein
MLENVPRSRSSLVAVAASLAVLVGCTASTDETLGRS